MLRLAAFACLLPACAAFSGTATIYRRHQPTYEARIVDGDQESIVVEDHEAGRHRVPRSEVAHVDHPGNVMAGFGLVAGLFSSDLILAAATNDEFDDDDRQSRYMTGAMLGVVAVVLVIGGGRAWWSSREAVGRTDPRPGVQPPVVPLAP